MSETDLAATNETHIDEHPPKPEPAVAPPFEAATVLRNRARELKMPYRVAIMALVVGLVGGTGGSYLFIRYFASAVPVSKQQLIVNETSAYINVAKKVSPAVVSITSQAVTEDMFGEPETESGAGTGMIVDSDGLILTNRHVVDETGANYTVVLANGKTYPAKVESIDQNNDMAFVKIAATGLPTVTLGDSGNVQIGQQVVAIGNALGQFQNSVTQGIISGLAREVTADSDDGSSGSLDPDESDSTDSSEDLQNMFQTDAAINPGNSGGPLVNLAGQVIGIDTAIAGDGAQNIGFAIPINDAKPLVASVEATGTINTAYLGVRYVELDPATAQANNLSVSQGAWIQEDQAGDPGVLPSSPAAAAGLQNGDVITKVGGKSVNETNSLQSLIESYKPGQKVKLTINRSGKTMTVTVTLGAQPSGS